MRRITTVALVLCVLLGVAIHAQPSSPSLSPSPTPSLDALFQKAEVDVARADAKVQKWARDATVSWLVVIVIAVLGILTAAVQAIKFKGKGFVTALIGGLVSGATVYSAATLPADYKTLNSLVSDGTELVESAKAWLAKAPALSNDDRVFALKEIADYMAKLEDLDITKRKTPAKPSAPGTTRMASFVTVVHAAESAMPQVCDCDALLRKGARKGELAACATASGSTLSEAHERAVTEAAKKLAAQLSGRMTTQRAPSSVQLVDFVRRFATEGESCPSSGKSIQLSVLLRLSESLANEQAIRAYGNRSASQARLKVTSIRAVADGSTGDTGWKFDVLVDGRVVAQIPARDYRDKPASQAVTTLSGASAIEAPVDLPKGSYWLVEIRGQRTKADITAVGAAAVTGMDKPVDIAVASPVAVNGSFVFSVAFTRPRS